jgi:hypothetical protein
MTTHSPDKEHDASRQVLEVLRTAPESLRRAAREAIEDGNQETFISLVTLYLQTLTTDSGQLLIPAKVLNRVDWDWLAGEVLAQPYPPDSESPPAGPLP